MDVPVLFNHPPTSVDIIWVGHLGDFQFFFHYSKAVRNIIVGEEYSCSQVESTELNIILSLWYTIIIGPMQSPVIQIFIFIYLSVLIKGTPVNLPPELRMNNLLLPMFSIPLASPQRYPPFWILFLSLLWGKWVFYHIHVTFTYFFIFIKIYK